MAKYLISFPSAAMVVPDGEWEAVASDAHAVIDEAKTAGVYVFGGGIDEDVPPVRVSADGAVTEGGYPWAPRLDGGFGSDPACAEAPAGLHLPARPAAPHEAANSANSATKRFGAIKWGEWLPSSWIESLAPGVCRCTQ